MADQAVRYHKLHIKPDLVPDLTVYPFIEDHGNGYVTVNVTALLSAFIDQDTEWLKVMSESIEALDNRARQVEANLPEGAQILPGTLDEADRAGYIDGLRAGARYLSLKLGTMLKKQENGNG